ncbi:MAG: hypothetical protein KDA85_09080, partial [Planctomycetaceae bacterium]|nr:hypothetical protein [Planctomycetaceae bacterium]
MLKICSSPFRFLLACPLLVVSCLLGGCNQTPPVPDPEPAAFLETAKASFKRNNAGEVVLIDLRGIEITDELLQQVAGLRNLKTLSLADTQVTDAQVALLKDLSDTVISIDLRNCPITNEAMLTIGSFAQLQALWLSGKSNASLVDDDGLAHLTALPELKIITLDDLWITNTGLEALKNSSKLEELYLANTSVDDDGMALISQFAQLKRIRLARTSVSDAGLAHLEKCTALVDLDLSEVSTISDAGLASLGKLKSL